MENIRNRQQLLKASMRPQSPLSRFRTRHHRLTARLRGEMELLWMAGEESARVKLLKLQLLTRLLVEVVVVILNVAE